MTDDSADPSERLAAARALVERADADPAAFTATEMERVASLLSADDPGVRVTAAEAVQKVFDRSELFEPVVPALIAATESYPDDVDGIPSPQRMMQSECVRAVIYVADALARVAQREPGVVEPHADRLVERLRSETNAPRHHALSLGYVAAETPDDVPTDEIRAALRELLDRGHGHGFPSWAAHALGRIGNPDDLAAVREARPQSPRDETVREAFDEAIAELERRRE